MRTFWISLCVLLVGFANLAVADTTIGGKLFVDSNSNGLLDDGESPISGIRIALMSGDKNVRFGESVTDQNGLFLFGDTFVTPLTTYFFVIDSDAATEPIYSSHPTITVSIGYQALKVYSGAAGTSKLDFNIGYADGFCGFVPVSGIANARHAISLIKANIGRVSFKSKIQSAIATKIGQARSSLSQIKSTNYRCGPQGNLCTQTTVTTGKEDANTKLEELRKLIRRYSTKPSLNRRLDKLTVQFKSDGEEIPDVVEDCS